MVSIPHRDIRKVLADFLRNDVNVFPFLIGTSESASINNAKKLRGRFPFLIGTSERLPKCKGNMFLRLVSIPHRDIRKSGGLRMVHPYSHVSIPPRDIRKRRRGPSILPEWRVSIPHRDIRKLIKDTENKVIG